MPGPGISISSPRPNILICFRTCTRHPHLEDEPLRHDRRHHTPQHMLDIRQPIPSPGSGRSAGPYGVTEYRRPAWPKSNEIRLYGSEIAFTFIDT
jgi:hypothetical protein